MIKYRATHKFHFASPFFSLRILPDSTSCGFLMLTHTSFVSTAALPQTYSVLKKKLPAVLKSKCFNDRNWSFAKEVRQTELGHLFEHILLEYLCQEKIDSGFDSVVHSGRTEWNWYKEERGTFHITIDALPSDFKYLPSALKKTNRLMSNLLSFSRPRPSLVASDYSAALLA